MEEHEVMYIPIEEYIHVSNDMKIDEMMQISLEPNIIMQMKHDFILLKGDLILQGNYRLLENEEPFDRKEPQMEQVQLLGENKAMFLHAFPIEIAIEKSKIKNLDDVSMQMEMFDYTIKNPVTIHLTANVRINGIDQTTSEKERKEDKKETDIISTQLHDEEKELDKVKQSKNEGQQVEETVQLHEADDIRMVEEEETPVTIGFSSNEQELDHTEEEEAIAEEAVEEETTKSPVSLFHMLFSNEDETEQYEHVKMYITQENDYLDKIAERYNLSVYQLMKDNDLTEDIIEAGQILKIKTKKKSS
ncbi:LysM peptidoglycan-binding domain-containing protein [Pseudogracilibacillus sp. ICA-222130]|uniref:LysM peptidoglycan-binding domain-containing protein n=1 Tax=Pseudogracilibacillus sp. ICA-222130 TaxID=3134655 RepID=UPI0030BA3C10